MASNVSIYEKANQILGRKKSVPGDMDYTDFIYINNDSDSVYMNTKIRYAIAPSHR